ncbi:FMN-dependent NADH-azoreductase 1 [Marinomonas spartinae]|uniref:FMN dependent NADH:quinone oxidoreductase n=1 Tax=Marinomonas spartinae TaxID=1792290 RepID=A0A1A8TRZ8_9GAMM|nr:NAD(P)H-dependent oxidoreductase [Marinomonas spartinae]SBS29562.1 FMN-dependent NADH-azoreductase 1 [Marinomonas spartinae]SBS36952.1 FMN-dependent NADH-azoreductase 1 [Marinomonas spartinae]
MKTILHIDSSVRRTDSSTQSYNSISKSFGRYFIELWLNKNHHDKVIYRDLGLNSPSFIDQDWIAAAFTPKGQRSPSQQQTLAESEEYFSELTQADVIVITSPMYNYGMPAVLKAWFDQMLRVNKTFTFDLARGDFPIEPTLSGKTLVLLTSSGEFGFGAGGVREHMNHLTPHIKALAQYLGVDQFYEIGSEYQEFSDERHQASVENAQQDIAALVDQLSE